MIILPPPPVYLAKPIDHYSFANWKTVKRLDNGSREAENQAALSNCPFICPIEDYFHDQQDKFLVTGK